MSLDDFTNVANRRAELIPKLGSRMIRGAGGLRTSPVPLHSPGLPGDDDDGDETFRRKPRSKRAQTIIEEARRALQYIEDRQAKERVEVAAITQQPSGPLSAGGSGSFNSTSAPGLPRSPLPPQPRSFASTLRSPSVDSDRSKAAIAASLAMGSELLSDPKSKHLQPADSVTLYEEPSLDLKKQIQLDRILKPKLFKYSETYLGGVRHDSDHHRGSAREAEDEGEESDDSDDDDDEMGDEGEEGGGGSPLPPLVTTSAHWAKQQWKSPVGGAPGLDSNSSCAGSVVSSGSKFLAARNLPPPEDVDIESLPPEIMNKYFGPESKIHFYEVYRDLNHKKNILSIGGYVDDAESGYMSLINASSIISVPPLSLAGGDEGSQFSSVVTKLKSSLSKGSSLVSVHEGGAAEGSAAASKKDKGGAEEDERDHQDAASIFGEESDMEESGSDDDVSTMASGSSVRQASIEGEDHFDEQSLGQGSSAFGTSSSIKKMKKKRGKKKGGRSVDEQSSRLTEESDDDDDLSLMGSVSTLNINSPRTRFLSGCIANNIPPRNALVLRSKLSTMLFLEHHGIGDKLAQLLASALGSMPLITSVNLADNNLNDDGLEPLLLSLVNCPLLREINFSENIIGPRAASALAALLSTPHCKIQAVRLKKANVDDGECHRFVEALKHNKYLEELDLSDNLLGKDENLNAVKPDIVTGGEALASLLEEGICPIKVLKVAWNRIRMEGAAKMCESFAFCSTLRHVDLSFNALGKEGGAALGRSLMSMPNLENLSLASNAIEPKGAFCICVAVRENKNVRVLNLDNNPIGDFGMRAMLTTVVYTSTLLSISAIGCDFSVLSPGVSYTRHDPIGVYNLNLADTFERAIFFDVLDCVAMDDSLSIEKLYYDVSGVKEPPSTGNAAAAAANVSEGSGELIELTKFMAPRDPETLGTAEREEINHFEQLQSMMSDKEVIAGLIQKFETLKRPGRVDPTEVGLLRSDAMGLIRAVVGSRMSPAQLQVLFAFFDICDDVTIVIREVFEGIIKKISADAALRIRDVKFIPRYSLDGGRSRYIPPILGRVSFRVEDVFKTSEECYSLTRSQAQTVAHLSRYHSDVSVPLRAAIDTFKVRCDEATLIYEMMMETTGDHASALAVVLPNMATSPDIRALFNKYGRTVNMGKRLEQLMGNAFRALFGPFNGFYRIDFRLSQDRLCMRKLMERSAASAQFRKQNDLGDLSQNGDWCSFRNKHIVVNPGMGAEEFNFSSKCLNPMPSVGIIEFDFSLAYFEEVMHFEAISDKFFLSKLMVCTFITSDELPGAQEWLENVSAEIIRHSTPVGFSPWQRDPPSARFIGTYLDDKFYSRLDQRFLQLVNIQEKERDNQNALNNHERLVIEKKKAKIKAQLGIQNVSAAVIGSSRKTVVASTTGAEAKKDGTAESALASDGSKAVAKAASDEGDASSSAPAAKGKTAAAKISKKTARPSKTKSQSDEVSVFPRKGDKFALAKCPKLVKSLIDLFSMGKLIRCKHLAYVLYLFTAGGYPRTDFGSYRVELVIALLSRVQDVQNIDLVMSFLTKVEQSCVIARLGWLVLFNTLRADNSYDLNLARWEERQIVKLLVQFAHTEPGTNFLDPSFCLDRSSPPVPGWELPVSWYVEDTLPNRGILSCRYYAGDGFCFKGCRPKRVMRYAVLPLCLIRLSDLIAEEKEFLSRFAPPPPANAKDARARSSSVVAANNGPPPIPASNAVSAIPNVAQSLEKIHSTLLALDPPITWTYNSIADCHAEVMVESED